MRTRELIMYIQPLATSEATEWEDECVGPFSFTGSRVSAITCDIRCRSRMEACLAPRRGGGDNDIISGEPGKISGDGGGSSGLGALSSDSGKYKRLGSEVICSAIGVEGCETQGSICVIGGVADRRFC